METDKHRVWRYAHNVLLTLTRLCEYANANVTGEYAFVTSSVQRPTSAFSSKDPFVVITKLSAKLCHWSATPESQTIRSSSQPRSVQKIRSLLLRNSLQNCATGLPPPESQTIRSSSTPTKPNNPKPTPPHQTKTHNPKTHTPPNTPHKTTNPKTTHHPTNTPHKTTPQNPPTPNVATAAFS
ncbi:hypothetical protein J6590_082001 [Homalodisca vitripennis]|nr:hypothetical protein J6590_082001 [Homalodisca vitripennis]